MPLSPFQLKYASDPTITYKPVKDGYSGYAYEDAANPQRLLGKDPALADKNEVVQSSAIGSRSATLDCYADTTAERDALVGLLFKKVTHNDGIEADRTVIVVAAKPRMWIWSGGVPGWIVSLMLRETV
jgi:hypothetical protein